MVLVFSLNSLALAEPIRILPLGDSITQGGRLPTEYTYRYPLQKMLVEGNCDFEFIGSMQQGLHGDFKWPDVDGKPFQLHHEGHYGWKTAAARDHLAEWMKTYPHAPDIVLIHLGTNDKDAGKTATDDDQKDKVYRQTIIKPLSDIITMLRSKNPKAVFLVGHLNFNGGAALLIRPLVEQMAKDLSTDDSPVVTVATYKGWHENPKSAEPDTFDWAHPNPQGQEKMARAYFDVMKPYLDKLQKQRGEGVLLPIGGRADGDHQR
jgi:lysophospholipase L1-like esterase